MSVDIREIPQRELRNNVSSILREVEDGGEVRITVRGKPVADLIPVRNDLPEPTPKDKVVALLKSNRPDPNLLQEIDEAVDSESRDVWKRHS